jgi:hypothetical protein
MVSSVTPFLAKNANLLSADAAKAAVDCFKGEATSNKKS